METGKNYHWTLALIALTTVLLAITFRQSINFSQMPLPDIEISGIPEVSADELGPIDHILANLKSAKIVFNAPLKIGLYTTQEIQLKLSKVASIEELKKIITVDGEKVGATIKISRRMTATLKGSAFKIIPIQKDTQAISETGVTEWKWQLKALEPGFRTLHLNISALIQVENESTERTIRTFDHEIHVEILFLPFVSENWKWIIGVVLFPLVIWLINLLLKEPQQST